MKCKAEILNRLIEMLCDERGEVPPPLNEKDKFNYFRALVNIRMPKPASREFICLQDKFLQDELQRRSITDIKDISAVKDNIYLWRGDITTLKCDGIVNAANSRMMGCFSPCHNCIDNAIHTFAGVQLRLECAEIIKSQGHFEPTGNAKLTGAYNLPCKYVLHTVGPIIYGEVEQTHKKQLEDCYLSCLRLADKNGLQSLAFCCISTGEFHFPNDIAAQIAVSTVEEYKRRTHSKIKIIFDVFKEVDYVIYSKLLGTNV